MCEDETHLGSSSANEIQAAHYLSPKESKLQSLSRRDFLKLANLLTTGALLSPSLSGDTEARDYSNHLDWKWTPAQEEFYHNYLIVIENGVDPTTGKPFLAQWTHERKKGRVYVTLPVVEQKGIRYPYDAKNDMPSDHLVRLLQQSVPRSMKDKEFIEYGVSFFLACDARARTDMNTILDQMQRNLEIGPDDQQPTPGYSLMKVCHPSGELKWYAPIFFGEDGVAKLIAVFKDSSAELQKKQRRATQLFVLEFTDFFAGAVIQEMHKTFKKDTRRLFIRCAMHVVPPLPKPAGELPKHHYSDYIVPERAWLDSLIPTYKDVKFGLKNFGLQIKEYANGDFVDRTAEFEPAIENAAQTVFDRVLEPLKDVRSIDGGHMEEFIDGRWVPVPGDNLKNYSRYRERLQPLHEGYKRYKEGRDEFNPDKLPLYHNIVRMYFFPTYHTQQSPPLR